MSNKTYDAFFEALGQRESGGNYNAINKRFRYLGKYQMGEESLIDTGYYKDDGRKTDNRFLDQFWTGKDGIKSKQDFLSNSKAQENAIREYMKVNWRYIQNLNLDLYVGQTIKGFFITTSGILAGAHLGGWERLRKFLKLGIIEADGNGVLITEYIEKFAGYDTPFKPRKRLTGIRKNKFGKTIAYQLDKKLWVDKETAIQMVRDMLLDGVIVNSPTGNVFLRTRPDNSLSNNLA